MTIATIPPLDWMTDLLTAAAELGYAVSAIDGRRVTLHELAGDASVTIDSILVSGPALRRLLRPLREPADA